MPTSPGSGFYGEASFDCQLADELSHYPMLYIYYDQLFPSCLNLNFIKVGSIGSYLPFYF